MKKCEIKIKGGIVIKAGTTPYVILVSDGNKTIVLTRTLLETMLKKEIGNCNINTRILGLLLDEAE